MIEEDQPVFVISVAAQLAGMHPQTLRIYERRGLVQPARTQGGTRRYSDADLEVLRRSEPVSRTQISAQRRIVASASARR